MTMTRASRYCVTCLANGHQCLAREGDWDPKDPALCIFCEDGAPCPVMQRSQSPQYRVNAATVKQDARRSSKLFRGLQSDNRNSLASVVERQPQQAVDRKQEQMGAKGTNAKTVPCKFAGCPTKVTERNKSGYCAKHFYVGKLKGGTPKTKRTAATPKLQRTAAKVAAVGNHNGSALSATLQVSEQQLDRMFLNWPMEDKTRCVQAWLDRIEG